jgi:uncharacterized membrane protein YdjX (TVP38/TMEM64 family)
MTGATARRALAAAALAGLAGGCAPKARPAAGPVSDAVREALASGTASFDHSAWDRLLAEGTRDGLVDYRHFQHGRPALDAYLEQIGTARLARLARAELAALLINAYNAATIRSILDHPSVASIREIDGVWTAARHRVGGYELTLDEIEHAILRPFFRDPRVHFALNCASRSCAPLPAWAFDGARLDEQLEARRRAFLSDPRNVRVEGEVLRLSRYFDWYRDDFVTGGWVGAAPSVAAYVRSGARPEVAAFLDLRGGSPPLAFLDYDWSLNAAVPPDPSILPPARDTQPGSGLVARLQAWVKGLGPLGPIVYALVYAALTVAFVPGSALTIGAGVAFGVAGGTLVASGGATLGAALCFLLSRTLLRRRVERWVEGRETFASLDRAVSREGWKIVALTRLSPVFPFNLLNYAFGLTGVGFWPYVLASWVAMLPGALLYVYLGAVGAAAAEAAAGAGSWGRTAIRAAGLVATITATVIIARIARRALQQAGRDDPRGAAQ